MQAFDPAAMPVAKRHLRHRASRYAPRSYDALAGADALAVVTEWNEFREPDFAKMRKLMKSPVDLRRPQHLLPRADAGAMASPTTPLGAEHGAVLVTGGAGYIGSHAAKALAAAGRRVVVYDDLSAGHRDAVRWCDLVVGDIHDDGRGPAGRCASTGSAP